MGATKGEAEMEMAFTSRNDKVLLMQGQHILAEDDVDAAKKLYGQLKRAIASASVDSRRQPRADQDSG